MITQFSACQTLAYQGLLNNQGLAVPPVTALVNEYHALSTVAEYRRIDKTQIAANSLSKLDSIASDCPALIGVVPEPYTTNQGSGELISRALARTTEWFDTAENLIEFSRYVVAAREYALQVNPIIENLAKSQFVDASVLSTITGGLSNFADDPLDLPKIAQGFSDAGDLVNISKPWQSFSALHLLNTLIENQVEHLANIDSKILGSEIWDSKINQLVPLTVFNVPELLANFSPGEIVAESIMDLTIQDLFVNKLSGQDLAQLQELLKINKISQTFQDFWDPKFYFSVIEQDQPGSILMRSANTKNIISALDQLIRKYLITTEITTSAGLTTALRSVKIPQITQFTNGNEVLTQQEFTVLSNSLGYGSGTSGVLTCVDFFGSTNYQEVLTNTLSALRQFFPNNTTTPELTPLRLNLKAIADYCESPTVIGDIVLSDGSSGYSTWDAIFTQIKTLCEPGISQVVATLRLQNLENLFESYNHLAKTHDNSAGNQNKFWTEYYDSDNDKILLMKFVDLLSEFGSENTTFDGFGFLLPCCDLTTITGQATQAAMYQAFNQKILNQNGIRTSAYSSAPEPLTKTPYQAVFGDVLANSTPVVQGFAGF